jgi:hypothetical protein
MAVWLPWTTRKILNEHALSFWQKMRVFMFKRLLTIFCTFILLVSWPSILNAGVSQTASFTLSVTIPERTPTPEPPATIQSLITKDMALFMDQRVYIQEDIRDHTRVYLASFVVD